MTEFSVNGMTCGNCARKVTTALQGVPGVAAVVVNVEARRASVQWAADTDVPAAIAALEKAGYDAKPVDSSQAAAPVRNWHLNLWVGVAVTAALMLGEWAFGLMMEPWYRWASFALATVVQVYCGGDFYRGAWRQLKVGSSNMDTLVALGSTTAYAFSAWVMLTGRTGHVYFMEAASIISLVSIGHWLEARVGERASSALKSLMQLAPPTARRIQRTGSGKPRAEGGFDFRKLSFSKQTLQAPQVEAEVEVPVADLMENDVVVLRPGERVPVDGVVTEGESAVDEAMLTGESAPVDKRSGSELFAGTMNVNGRLVMRVTATGEATALAHIITAVQRAQSSRADIQRLGDRISNVFVPIVVAVALAAGLWWGGNVSAERGFIVAAAVLIVACPCAMGLATPAAIMAAANAAAKRGFLIRDGVALEKAGQITAVAFDKTGTLTVGQPTVAAVTECGVRSAECGMRQLAAALAGNSTHPVSRALAGLSSEKIEFRDWQEVRGSGVEGVIVKAAPGEAWEKKVRLGSLEWLGGYGVDLKPGDTFVAEWTGQGATVVGLAVGNELVGLFAVKDTLKPGSAAVVGQLQGDGRQTFLITGDNAATAAGIAKQCGIPENNVFAGVKPEQKAEFIKKIQAQGQRVAFVGDGINDAPALMQADLGIAVGKASDVARESADIILLRSDIEAVPEVLGLARAALRTIKQNLFWAFFYNVVAIPFAATGHMSPVLCAAAMGFSDIIVIGNALRLARWKARR